MKHLMRLHAKPFSMMEQGIKTIELRLYDEKRQTICIGDEIEFSNLSNERKRLTCIVKKLHIFPSFEALYAQLPLLKCGYTEEDIATASHTDMEQYYTKEEQKEYGVVGIELQLTKEDI